MTNLNGLPVTRYDSKATGCSTIFVPLPPALHRPIEGGCACEVCKARPDRTPMWDTLAIAAKPTKNTVQFHRDFTWTVHYPELQP